MVLIRPATRDDLGAITRLYAHHVETGTASFELSPPSLVEMTERYLEITGHGLPYLVASLAADTSVVAGYAYASYYRSRPGYRFTVEDSLYVDPKHIRRGIGRSLLQAVIDGSEALGYRQMLAVIGGADNSPSIGLHAERGFNQVGRLANVGRKFDRWIDTVIMQRGLGAGATTPP